MFDIGALELLVIVIVAVIVIGPKDMPLAMRTAGRWIGKIRRVSAHFRTGLDAMVREAELEDMEQHWKARNEAIMREHPRADGDVASEGAVAMTGPPAQPQDRNTKTEAGEQSGTGSAASSADAKSAASSADAKSAASSADAKSAASSADARSGASPPDIRSES